MVTLQNLGDQIAYLRGTVRNDEVAALAESPDLDRLIADVARVLTTTLPDEETGVISVAVALNGCFARFEGDKYFHQKFVGPGKSSRSLADVLYRDSLGKLSRSAISARLELEGATLELHNFKCGDRYVISMKP
ncbi:hypothetical protein FWC63_02950 [Candidatus Saccharibacteria bacterium]|nr:hypothetical protein [Candidatus Saccharibacteria bacterium]